MIAEVASYLHRQLDQSPPKFQKDHLNSDWYHMNRRLNHLECSNCGRSFSDPNHLRIHITVCMDSAAYSRDGYCPNRNAEYNHTFRYSADQISDRYAYKMNDSNRLTSLSHDDLRLSPLKSQPIDWKFSSGRIEIDRLAELHFSGAVVDNSLIGGCGWWVVSRDLVIAYGGAPVIQNFPYLVKLKYEGLLNGIQAALKKGIKRIIIKCSDPSMILHLTNGDNGLMFFHTHRYVVKDIYIAILRALKLFNSYSIEYILHNENCPSVKLAKKSIADYYYNREVNVAKKCNVSIPIQNHTNGIKSHESMKTVLLSDMNINESIKEFHQGLLDIRYK